MNILIRREYYLKFRLHCLTLFILSLLSKNTKNKILCVNFAAISRKLGGYKVLDYITEGKKSYLLQKTVIQ